MDDKRKGTEADEAMESQQEGWLERGDPRCVSSPGVATKATIRQEMPEQVAEVLRKENLRIRLDKIVANRLIDQVPGMLAKDGCISAPSGPGC